MGEADRIIKTGDTFPPHIRVLEDARGPRDLSGVVSVRIIARKDTITFITEPCTVMTIQEGLDTGWLEPPHDDPERWDDYLGVAAAVMWDINAGDTVIAGSYPYEFEIQHDVAGDDIETVPNRRSNNPVLTIEEDLD